MLYMCWIQGISIPIPSQDNEYKYIPYGFLLIGKYLSATIKKFKRFLKKKYRQRVANEYYRLF